VLVAVAGVLDQLLLGQLEPLGLALAGEIVTAVSGKAYADYVGEHILSPLGMKRTFVTTPPADLPDLATGYTRRLPSKPRGPAPFTDGRGITAGADMTTCVSDADDGTPTMVVDKAYQWVAPAIRPSCPFSRAVRSRTTSPPSNVRLPSASPLSRKPLRLRPDHGCPWR